MTKNEKKLFEAVPANEFNTYWVPCTWFIFRWMLWAVEIPSKLPPHLMYSCFQHRFIQGPGSCKEGKTVEPVRSWKHHEGLSSSESLWTSSCYPRPCSVTFLDIFMMLWTGQDWLSRWQEWLPGWPVERQEFCEFRARCGLLWCYDWVSIPMVYTQVCLKT